MPKGLIIHNRLGSVGSRCVLPLILTAAACSSSTAAQTDVGSAIAVSGQPIGTQGGTVSQDGATLVISAGALPSDTAFTITTTNAPPLDGVASIGFEFGPDVTFATVVTITIPLLTEAPDAHLYWIPRTNGLLDLGGVVSGLSITAQVSRLGGLTFACIPNYSGNSADCNDLLSDGGATGTDAGVGATD